MSTFSVVVYTQTKSELNQRDHWAARHRRAQAQKKETHLMLALCSRQKPYGSAAKPWKPTLPCEVTLTRISPRRLDGDNLQGALKYIRDEVADWIGVDDADDRVEWSYRQENGKHAVRITIEEDKHNAIQN